MKEYVLDKLNEEKFGHSKMDNIVHTELKMQNYLLSEDISVEQKRTIFLFRTRMAQFSENYKENNQIVKPCQICKMHMDSQAHSIVCVETMRHVKHRGNYEEIFTNNISSETANMLQEILEYRKNKLG